MVWSSEHFRGSSTKTSESNHKSIRWDSSISGFISLSTEEEFQLFVPRRWSECFRATGRESVGLNWAQSLPLVRRQLRVPNVYDEDEAVTVSILPDLMLKWVVKDEDFTLLPLPAEETGVEQSEVSILHRTAMDCGYFLKKSGLKSFWGVRLAQQASRAG